MIDNIPRMHSLLEGVAWRVLSKIPIFVESLIIRMGECKHLLLYSKVKASSRHHVQVDLVIGRHAVNQQTST